MSKQTLGQQFGQLVLELCEQSKNNKFIFSQLHDLFVALRPKQKKATINSARILSKFADHKGSTWGTQQTDLWTINIEKLKEYIGENPFSRPSSPGTKMDSVAKMRMKRWYLRLAIAIKTLDIQLRKMKYGSEEYEATFFIRHSLLDGMFAIEEVLSISSLTLYLKKNGLSKPFLGAEYDLDKSVLFSSKEVHLSNHVRQVLSSN